MVWQVLWYVRDITLIGMLCILISKRIYQVDIVEMLLHLVLIFTHAHTHSSPVLSRSPFITSLALTFSLSHIGYAQPQFIRVQSQIEKTATFKYTKVGLVKEGFDPSKVSHVFICSHVPGLCCVVLCGMFHMYGISYSSLLHLSLSLSPLSSLSIISFLPSFHLFSSFFSPYNKPGSRPLIFP